MIIVNTDRCYPLITGCDKQNAMSAKQVGQRIREARQKNKMSQGKLAELCGWGKSQSRISNYESGEREPNYGDLSKIAKVLGCTASELAFGSTPPDLVILDDHDNISAIAEAKPAYFTETARVPLISWVQAGNWCNVSDPYPPGFGEKLIPTTKRVGPRAFAVKVRGQSMENPRGLPTYPENSIIIVDPDVLPENGKRVVAKLDNDEVTFKQFIRDAGRVYLNPLNPRFDPIPVDESVSICGTVVDTFLDQD